MLIWEVGELIDKMYKENWFTGPDWLEKVDEWPQQPVLRKTTQIEEEKPQQELVVQVSQTQRDRWDDLLARWSY